MVVDEIRLSTRFGEWPALAAGDRRRPAVLCLHGFPDHPATFENNLLPALAEAGYYAVAPWLRGYGPAPRQVPKRLGPLADDVLAWADAVSPESPVSIVGHDWGAILTYLATMERPERFAAAITLAVPHPVAFVRNLVRFPGQLRRSWYLGFFQLPGISDRLARAGGFSLVEHLWRRWSPGLPLPPDFPALIDALDRTWPAPLLYYRALRRPPLRLRRIRVPTLALCGADDGCIGPSLGHGQERLFAGPFSTDVLLGAGHFLHREAPRECARRILGWIGSHHLDLAPVRG